MRLLIATPLYPPDPGGPATYAALLEEGLPAEGVDVALALFSDVRPLPKIIRHVAYAWEVFRMARNADAVLALDPVSTGFPAMLAAFVARKPFLVKVVGDYAWEQGVQRCAITESLDEFVEKRAVPILVRALRFLQTLVANHARVVIVPSQYLKRIVGRWGVDEDRIAVIPNAFELGSVGSTKSYGARTVVTAGRLVPWKGIDGVIEAMAHVGKEHTDVVLVIVGDGPERGRLESLAQAACSERVVFTGALAHAELMAVIQQADVFVLNSTYEGLSHLLLESLSLGTPTVATSVGGNPELIRNEENGLLVPVEDTEALKRAIARLLSDKALSERLATEGRKTREAYGPARMIGSLVTLLKEKV